MAYRATRFLAALLAGQVAAFAPALAQTPPAPAAKPPPEHVAIQPEALAILKAASQRLANAKSLRFTAVTTWQAPARNGQPLYYTTLSEVALRRPDRLRVITPGDGPASEFYFDGKEMMAYAPAVNLVAIADVAGTIDDVLNAAYEKHATYFPWSELLVADPYKNVTEGLVSAFVVGQSHVVGDTITDIVALANENVQAEIWIGVKDGLPRMVRVSYPKDPNRVGHEVVFSNWRLDTPVKEAEFTSEKAKKAPRMAFARPDAPVPEKK